MGTVTEGMSSGPSQPPSLTGETLQVFWRSEDNLRRYAGLLVLAFLLHAAPLTALLVYDFLRPPIEIPSEEIAVEVVAEPPQPQAEAPPPPPPPPQPPKPEEPPKPEQKQPEPQQQKLRLDEKPAYDAPRAENKEQLKREAPDDSTKSPRLARPEDKTAEKPDPVKPQKPQQQREPDPVQEQGESAATEEDAREAEVLERATPKQEPKPQKRAGSPDPKAARGERQKSIAEQIASLEPAPHYKLGGSAKVAPISGGQADPSYLSVVYGYIMRKFHPAGARPEAGVISFYIDPGGHLVHQALRKSSGSPERDQEALAALRRAAPFPPPPEGASVGLAWQF
jgi:TonB family protein